MKSGICVISNSINGREYIGGSSNIRKIIHNYRWMLRTGNHPNPYLQDDYKEHGKGAFCFTVLEYCAKENIKVRKKWWMDYLKSTYNIWDPIEGLIDDAIRAKMCASGNGQQRGLGRKHTPEELEKMRLAHTGRVITLEWRAKQSAALKGKPWTEARRNAEKKGKTP
jgi:group I intron endonuclease